LIKFSGISWNFIRNFFFHHQKSWKMKICHLKFDSRNLLVKWNLNLMNLQLDKCGTYVDIDRYQNRDLNFKFEIFFQFSLAKYWNEWVFFRKLSSSLWFPTPPPQFWHLYMDGDAIYNLLYQENCSFNCKHLKLPSMSILLKIYKLPVTYGNLCEGNLPVTYR